LSVGKKFLDDVWISSLRNLGALCDSSVSMLNTVGPQSRRGRGELAEKSVFSLV